MLAATFHGYGFSVITVELSSITNGPCSYMKPRRDEQPGPPLNHTTTGSAVAFPVLSTKI